MKKKRGRRRKLVTRDVRFSVSVTAEQAELIDSILGPTETRAEFARQAAVAEAERRKAEAD